MSSTNKINDIPKKIEQAYSSKDLDPKNFVFVRMFKYKDDIENGKLYASPFRPTVHFTLNSIVESSPYGNWSDAKYALITPMYETVKENKENFLGGSSADMYFLGYVKLPKGYKIIERGKNESYENFKKRVVNEIKQREHKVLESGFWSAFSSSPDEEFYCVNKLFGNLEKKVGKRYFGVVPTESAFGQIERYVRSLTKEKNEPLSLSKIFAMKKLKELGIANSQFKIKINQENIVNPEIEENCAIINNQYFKTFELGIDIIEFLISTNKGEKVKALSTVASGGEISRVMLAIKSILAESDQLPILIFDEIDTGISGGIAQKVGLAMKYLSKSHQIISITHLPQICGLADRNIYVEKKEQNNRTFINVKILNEEEKIEETARLLSGESITKSTLESAKELISAR